jgi:acetyltransferase-like isoleucine patch superfamily enzyme
VLGKFCSISWGVTIGPGEHDYSKITCHDFLYNDYYEIKPKDFAEPYNRYIKSVEICNDVWVGANSIILRGVKVGNGAVIGANSLVTKDVPPYAIVVGSPAKVLKYRFDENCIKKLQRLKWWDFDLAELKENFFNFCNDNIEIAIKNLTECRENK